MNKYSIGGGGGGVGGVSLLLVLVMVLVSHVSASGSTYSLNPTSFADPTTADFQRRHGEKVASLNSPGKVWKQNDTLMVNFVPGQTTYVDVRSGVYWQRNTYDEAGRSFSFDQVWPRGNGIYVYQRIISEVNPPVFALIDYPPTRQELRSEYNTRWTTTPIFDQQLATVLPIDTFAMSASTGMTVFLNPLDGKAVFDEVIQVQSDNKRYYSYNFYDYSNPSALAAWGYFNSDEVDISDTPAGVQAVFQAVDDGTLSTIVDPLDPNGQYEVLGLQVTTRSSDEMNVKSVSSNVWSMVNKMHGPSLRAVARAQK